MIKPEKYVTDILSLDDLQRAMERQIDPNDKLIKSVIKFNYCKNIFNSLVRY